MGTCPNCGKIPPKSKGSAVRIYCDEKCRRKYEKLKQKLLRGADWSERTCVECDTVFKPKAQNQICCQTECTYKRKQRLKKGYERKQTEAVDVDFMRKCARPGCDNEFHVNNKNISRIYCGKRCNQYMYNYRRGRNVPAMANCWRGPIPDFSKQNYPEWALRGH
jgi:hypothetical protein